MSDVSGGNAWTRFVREAWNDVRQLVRVQHMEKADVPILAPTQSFFLRENLKLRLIGARLALLTRDQASYKDDPQRRARLAHALLRRRGQGGSEHGCYTAHAAREPYQHTAA